MARLRVLVAIGVCCSICTTVSAEYLGYQELLDNIRDGHVKSITLTETSAIEGILVKGDAEVEFTSRHADGKNDELLLDLLRKHDVKIELKDDRPTRPYIPCVSGVLLIGIPTVLIVLLLRANKRLKRIEGMLSGSAKAEQW